MAGAGKRDTYPPFSPDEVAQIRSMFETAGPSLVCPKCRNPLSSEDATIGTATSVLHLYCDRCQRSMVLRGGRG